MLAFVYFKVNCVLRLPTFVYFSLWTSTSDWVLPHASLALLIPRIVYIWLLKKVLTADVAPRVR